MSWELLALTCPHCGASLVGDNDYVKCAYAAAVTQDGKTCGYGVKDKVTYETYQQHDK